MSSKISAEFFAGNRSRLRERVESGVPIVVTANGLLQRGGDSPYAFHQDSNFYYLIGINEPDILVVLDGSSEYLIVPGRSKSRAIFDGTPNADELAEASGIREILDEGAGWDKLKASVLKSKSMATLLAPPSYEKHYGFYTNPARVRLLKRLRRLAPTASVVDIRKTLATMRMIKQSVEIEAVQEAIDITASGIEKVKEKFASFSYEYEIEAELTKQFRAAGATGHAFAPIVASGKNACTLHNISNNSKLAKGELVVIDVGAEVNNYAADITRTVSLSGEFSARQRQVYDAVREVQGFAIPLQKPGAPIKENEAKIRQFMGEKLKQLGLIKNINSESVQQYYPHSTNHFLGLDVHDVGDYGQPLTPNTVLTVEPGIYIPEEGIGVRIEDDILITETGNQVMSDGLKR